jgi:hypothetical protein
MTHSDFHVGLEFSCGGRRWRCTDIGMRTIAAMCLSEHPDDDSWYNGPPYAVAERVFDEYDMEGCAGLNGGESAVPPQAREQRGSTWHYQAYRDTDGIIQIYEDYFDDSGAWEARTEQPIAPMGESYEELVRDLRHMLRDVMVHRVKELDAGDES